MTKIGILTIEDNFENAPTLTLFKKMETELKIKNILLDPKEIKFVFSGKKINGEEKPKYINYKNKKINLDIIVPRLSSHVGLNQFNWAINAMDFIRNHTDIPVINFTKGMLISNDKFWQGEYVAAHGYKTPKTVFIGSLSEISDALSEFGTYPLIVKTQYGSEGEGVAIVESERSAKSVISSMITGGNHVIVQEYLPVEEGKDYRLYVVGNKIVKGVIRTAPKKDFRANVTLGGKKKVFKPSKELKNMAIDIASLVGLEIATVDFMCYKDQYYFIEINKNPGASKDNTTAKAMLEYIKERSKKKVKKIKTSNKTYRINSVEDIKRVFRDLDINIFGVSSKAFRSISPAFFIDDNYGILSYKTTDDIDLIKKYCRVRSMQEKDLDYINYNAPIRNTDNIEYAEIENYLRRFKNVHLVINEITPQIKNLIEKTNVSIVKTNLFKVREKYENKLYFRKFLEKIDIPGARYKNYPYLDFINFEYKKIQEKFGKKFVVQLPESSSGGGRNTFFVRREKEFIKIRKIAKKRIYRDEEIQSVNILEYMPGISISLNCCVTKYGVLTGQPMLQLIDIPELRNKKSIYQGKYCGVEWKPGFISQELENEIKRIARKVGKAMRKASNYRGLFGLDFVYNKTKDRLIVIECNPRQTGSIVTEDMFRLKNDLIPFEALQYLESFKIKYNFNFEKSAKKYDKLQKTGSNLYLYNRKNKAIKLNNTIKPGIYSYNRNGKLKYVKESLLMKDLSENQFILAESITSKDTTVILEDDTSQILRLIFKTNTTDDNGKLKPVIKKIVKNIYEKLEI